MKTKLGQDIFRQGTWVFLLVVFVTLVISLGSYAFVKGKAHKEFTQSFEVVSKTQFRLIKENFKHVLDSLDFLRLFFDSSEYISRDEFTGFTYGVLGSNNIAKNLLWAPFVEAKDKHSLEQNARREGISDFRINQIVKMHKTIDAQKRAFYYPVLYMEPFLNSRFGLGFDLNSESLYADAIRQAKITGKPEATKAFHVQIGNQYRLAFFACIPIYKKEAIDFVPEGRLEGFLGVVGGIFKYAELIEPVFSNMAEKKVTFFLFDSCIGEEQMQLIYLSKADSQTLWSQVSDFKNVRFRDLPKLFQSYEHYKIREFHLFGRKWVVVQVADQAMLDTYFTAAPVYVATSVCFMGLLVMVIIGGLLKRSLFVESMVEQRTKTLNETKEALEKSRQQYMLAISGSQDGIWDWDLKNNELFLSGKWKEMIGYTDEEFPNTYEAFFEHVHSEDKPRIEAYLDKYLKGDIAHYKIEFRLRHKNGSYIDILSKGEAVRDNNGIPYRMAGSHTDITERKLKEKDLIRSETKFRTLYNNNSEAIMLLDMNTFIDCNEQTIKLFRFNTKYDFLKKHLGDVSPKTQPCGTPSYKKAQEYMRQALREGRAKFEWVHRKNNGMDFLAEVTLDAMEIDGQMIIQAIVRDISQEKQAVVEIQQNLEELERFNRIMLERESRILEIKQEVNDLCKKLGEPPRYKTTA